MGGSALVVAPRVAVLSNHMGCILTPEEILDDFKDFYYECALSAHAASLTALDAFVAPNHILFGTDFPGKRVAPRLPFPDFKRNYLAVSMDMADWYTKHVQNHYAYDTPQLERVMCENALQLFPRLRDLMLKRA